MLQFVPTGMRGRLAWMMVLCACCFGATLEADVVILKNGERIEGRIIGDANGDPVTIFVESSGTHSGLRTFTRKEIREVRTGDGAAAEDVAADGGAPRQDRPALGTIRMIGHVQCDPSNDDVGKRVTAGLRNAINEGDDLVLLELLDEPLMPSDVRMVMDCVSGFDAAKRARCVIYVHGARKQASLLPLVFPRVVFAPDARLVGMPASERPGAMCGELRILVKGCHPDRIALAEALCSGTAVAHAPNRGWFVPDGLRHPTDGTLSLSYGDLGGTDLADGTSRTLKSVHTALGVRNAPEYRNRMVVTRAAAPPRQDARDRQQAMVQVQIDRYSKRFNDGLEEVEEGIELFLGPIPRGTRGNSGTLFDRVKDTWRSSTNNRPNLSEDDKQDQKKAIRLILGGINDMENAAKRFRDYLRQGHADPRLKRAVDALPDIEALEDALSRDKNPNDFERKCKAVHDLDPL
jgi:hypothetical protein